MGPKFRGRRQRAINQKIYQKEKMGKPPGRDLKRNFIRISIRVKENLKIL